MKRLTERDEYGNADIINVNSIDLQSNLEINEFNKVTNALNKLADYEDLELTPEQIKEMDKLYTEKCEQVHVLKESVEELCNKIRELEDKNE